ncbi:prolyl-tRNA synthetase associated domain-containing protein [Luxibacter massiliensis]|uniref:prolyl-tRNA synthetase associated domain-containing protein n=1 Tax=Luxibacter massiliensis TaxID=2219695 RepID=UPI000F067056|nr:prolyl-tRNA synthetase associated domain-containing protein [Luxibacter massiliensis]
MSEIYVSRQHFTTQPDCTRRIEAEIAVYALLDRLHIPYEGVDHDVAPTIEACKAVEEELGIMPCKNLFLRNRQKTSFYLLLMPGEKKFLTKDLSGQLHISRLSFAEPEFMEKYLGLTPGSVSVLGLMNDSGRDVSLLIDRDLLSCQYIGCHPCINTSSLKIKTGDILNKFLEHTGHSYCEVTL